MDYSISTEDFAKMNQELAKISTDIAWIKEALIDNRSKQDKSYETLCSKDKDLECRIEVQENWRMYLIGGMAIISILLIWIASGKVIINI